MFKRLAVLFLMAATVLSISTPARASTPIGVNMMCYQYSIQWPSYATYRCYAYASGGTGSYVSYTWKAYGSYGSTTLFTSQPELDYNCSAGEQFRIDVYVTDSAGATGSIMGDYYACNTGGYEPFEY